MSERHLLDCGDAEVCLTVRVNRRARRPILRLDPRRGEMVLVAPSRRGVAAALRFADAHRDWILEQLRRLPPAVPFTDGQVIPLRGVAHQIVNVPEARRGVWREVVPGASPRICASGRPEFTPRRVRDWLRAQAGNDMLQLATAFSDALDLTPPRVTVRDTTAQWGSCTEDGRLSFSWRLILTPDFVRGYLAAHETAHRIEKSHNRHFVKLVDGLTPSRRAASAWLREHGMALHRYG